MSSPVYLLGISCDYHDAAAALLKDGVIVAAAHEERFTRVKHDERIPESAISYCLAEAGITLADVCGIVFYEKPLVKFERLLKTYIRTWPKGLKSFIQAMLSFLTKKLWIEQRVRKLLSYNGPFYYVDHHIAHAASAFYPSGFDDAILITMDGVGEDDTTTIGYGKGMQVSLTHSIHFPHSLGLLYSALTYYLGFKVNSAEYKVMGLAPYGNPAVFRDRIAKLVTRYPDGSFTLNMEYFSYEYALVMTSKKFDTLFGGKARTGESGVSQREKDIAAALQELTNELVLGIVRHATKLYETRRVCFAGGVALNCVANSVVLNSGLVDELYIQPASGDAGGSVGAALYVYYHVWKKASPQDKNPMPHVYLGPSYTDEQIISYLEKEVPDSFDGKRVAYHVCASREELLAKTADLLVGTNVIGWMQGRMEFGPRSLGSRSILADARNKENWQKVNLKIKFRESFRPFAPSVLWEYAGEWFRTKVKSPFMLLTAQVLRDGVPAVTHVDGSARLQTVCREDHPLYYDLLRAFYDKTGCPVIINTSFNVRSEPIVCSPKDAFSTFINTYMDYLVMGNIIVSKKDNMHFVDEARMKEFLGSFTLD